MSEFQAALLKKFQDHRVVFWYDEKNELREQFDELDISGIEKIHVTGNEFQVKYQVNVTNPKTQHLLYFSAPKPANEENWLLDMELMHTIFHTDQESMILQEIGLEQYFKELVANHIEYFKSKWRISKLRALIKKDDDYREIKEKMLAVTFGSEHIGWASFIHAHALAFTNANDKVDQELVRFNLHEYYWQEIKTRYQYQSESPAIYDFLIDVFSKILRVENRLEKTSDSQLLISLWKDSLKYRDSFAKISDKIAYDLDIESTLEGKSLLHLENDDLFQLSDMKIIQLLTDGIINRELSHEKVIGFTKLRHNKFWYSEFKHFYESIDYASEIISLIQKYENLKFESWDSGVKEYSDNLFQIDLLYRKFIWSYQKTNQNMILFDVSEKVEKMYSNDWLLNVNNNWQVIVDNLELWPSKDYHAQSKLFDNHIKSYIDQKLRLFIIISDGLRFECGYELSKMLHAENRYDANIDYMVTGIPSYTQMGMASMLPHKQMTLKENSELILLDGQTSSGIKPRRKILDKIPGIRATAVSSEDIMKMNSATEGRKFVKDHDLIYIYHDRIDDTGDEITSEAKVFDAVDDELEYLVGLIKKISNMNGQHMLVTSDHGFIYQNQPLEDSDFTDAKITGDIWKEKRRYVIGTNLEAESSVKKFTSKQVGLEGDVDILIPKSINRIRKRGSGSRYTHGGSSLQEIVIPLIKISKGRQDTVSKVGIDIIQTTDRITTNILAISFIQTDLVTDSILSREMRAGIYSSDNELLSDLMTYNFDISQGRERQREVKHRFTLNSQVIGKYKNKRVFLVLEEPIDGTSKWKKYKKFGYNMNISFTNDFDEF